MPCMYLQLRSLDRRFAPFSHPTFADATLAQQLRHRPSVLCSPPLHFPQPSRARILEIACHLNSTNPLAGDDKTTSCNLIWQRRCAHAVSPLEPIHHMSTSWKALMPRMARLCGDDAMRLLPPDCPASSGPGTTIGFSVRSMNTNMHAPVYSRACTTQRIRQQQMMIHPARWARSRGRGAGVAQAQHHHGRQTAAAGGHAPRSSQCGRGTCRRGG